MRHLLRQQSCTGMPHRIEVVGKINIHCFAPMYAFFCLSRLACTICAVFASVFRFVIASISEIIVIHHFLVIPYIIFADITRYGSHLVPYTEIFPDADTILFGCIEYTHQAALFIEHMLHPLSSLFVIITICIAVIVTVSLLNQIAH